MKPRSSQPRLPILNTLWQAHRLLAGHSRHVLVNAPIWAILTALAVAAHFHFDYTYSPFPTGHPASALSSVLISHLIRAVGFAVFAVGWHRHVLPVSPRQRDTSNRSRIFRYAAMAFAVDAALIVPLASMYVWTILSPNTNQYVQLAVGAVLILCCVYLAGRCFLALPCVALDHSPAIATSWSAMQGNVLRLIVTAVLAVLPAILISEPLGRAYNAAIDTNLLMFRYSPHLRLVGDVFAWWVNATIVMSVLTVAYMRLVGGKQPVSGE